MKIAVDKEYMASVEGVVRVAAIGLGGAIFGTMANGQMYFISLADDDAASAHFLMWVAVFAWAITTIVFICGLLSNPVFTGGAEYRINFFFSILYLIASVVYGRFNVEWGPNRDPKILILVYSCVNWLMYLILFFIQLCTSDVRKKMTPKKKAKRTETVDDKVVLKEQADAEVGVSARIVENGKDEEPEVEQPQEEQKELPVA